MNLPNRAAARPLTAISLKVASLLAFVAMQTLIKLAGQLPAGQIVFFRSFFAIVPILVLLAWRRELATAFQTQRPGRHVTRGVVGVFAMGLGFFALTRLPLPEAIMLNYAQPMLVVVLSALVLSEPVRAFRWTAVAIGFVGVLIITWPKLSLFASPEGVDRAQALGVMAALAAAAFSAVAVLQVRSLTATDRSSTIVLWFSLTAAGWALLSLPFGWEALTARQALLLVMTGILGGIGQILMTESYRHAGIATIAPFEYTSILFAFVFGYMLFGDVPTIYTVVGGIIIVGSGLFIIWREQRLGLERANQAKVTPPN